MHEALISRVSEGPGTIRAVVFTPGKKLPTLYEFRVDSLRTVIGPLGDKETVGLKRTTNVSLSVVGKV